MPQGAGFEIEQIVRNQGLEEEVGSAGSEHISHFSSKNPGTKPSPWCSKQHSHLHSLPPPRTGEI